MGLGYVKSTRHAARDRRIMARLADHADHMRRFEAQGMSREDASREAMRMVEAGVLVDSERSHKE